MTGWSLKRIEREAFRREWERYADESAYHPLRDGPRQQGWTWAIDAMRDELAPAAWQAAHDFYRAQQSAKGDIKQQERPRVDASAIAFDTAVWVRQRAEAIERAAVAYLWAHQDRTQARWATFVCAFHWRQPTLAHVRIHGRPGGARTHPETGAYLRLNERETKQRIVWCGDVLAEHFADIGRAYGRS